MIAFAANSLLNRLALLEGEIGPGGFAAIRVVTGALVLALMVIARNRSLPQPIKPQLVPVASLTIYMLGFSFAYVAMDAGLGALVLFGGVQLTMFAAVLAEGVMPPLQRWLGMGLAMTGLMMLTLPSGPIVVDYHSMALMTFAAIGWGIYSLVGRHVSKPLEATGWNFAYSVPIVIIVLFLWPDDIGPSLRGIMLAMVSGGITSALGYALWYSLMPTLGATKAALTQLSAPAIALCLGVLLLNETLTWVSFGAAVLILGGIAVGLIPLGKKR